MQYYSFIIYAQAALETHTQIPFYVARINDKVVAISPDEIVVEKSFLP